MEEARLLCLVESATDAFDRMEAQVTQHQYSLLEAAMRSIRQIVPSFEFSSWRKGVSRKSPAPDLHAVDDSLSDAAQGKGAIVEDENVESLEECNRAETVPILQDVDGVDECREVEIVATLQDEDRVEECAEVEVVASPGHLVTGGHNSEEVEGRYSLGKSLSSLALQEVDCASDDDVSPQDELQPEEMEQHTIQQDAVQVEGREEDAEPASPLPLDDECECLPDEGVARLALEVIDCTLDSDVSPQDAVQMEEKEVDVPRSSLPIDDESRCLRDGGVGDEDGCWRADGNAAESLAEVENVAEPPAGDDSSLHPVLAASDGEREQSMPSLSIDLGAVFPTDCSQRDLASLPLVQLPVPEEDVVDMDWQQRREQSIAAGIGPEGGIGSDVSKQRRGNVVDRTNGLKSFLPLMKQQAVPPPSRVVKVWALEAAQAAKKVEEQRDRERKMRKEQQKLQKEEKAKQLRDEERQKERKTRVEQEKLSEVGNKALAKVGVTSRTAAECTMKKRKLTSTGARGVLTDCSHTFLNSQVVPSKVNRASEVKSRMDQEKARKAEEDRRRREEEFKKLEEEMKKKWAELAAKKRGRQEAEMEEQDGKRRKEDEAMPSCEERQQAEMADDEKGLTPVQERPIAALDLGPQSYEISPYRASSDDEDEDEEDEGNGSTKKEQKPIPLWARSEYLLPAIIKQQHIDPDNIFSGAKTCSLNEVFGTKGSKKKGDWGKRSLSGNWLEDRVTWKEELLYKQLMGYSSCVQAIAENEP